MVAQIMTLQIFIYFSIICHPTLFTVWQHCVPPHGIERWKLDAYSLRNFVASAQGTEQEWQDFSGQYNDWSCALYRCCKFVNFLFKF